MLKNSICVIALFAARSIFGQATCGNVQLQLTPDYSFAIGSSGGGSAYTFTLNGQKLAQGPMTQLELLHFDSSLNSTSGVAPAQSKGTSFVPGKFGMAVTVAAGGTLSYAQPGNVSFADGTVEMWVSPQYDGSNSIYTGNTGTPQAQVLFHSFWGGSGGELILAIANHGGGPYFYVGAAGVYVGYPQASGITAWRAGEWHHLALTYSTSQGRLRLYVDGAQAQESDAKIQFPAVSPNTFTIAGDVSGHESAFAVDEVRITSDEMPAAAIAYDATRATPFAHDEVYLPLASVSPGPLNYSVSTCGSATYNFTGIPISNFSPPSGLLKAGSASVTLAFNTVQPTTCRYSVGNPLDYNSMLQLDTGAPTASHKVVASGLSTDPRVLNRLYVRCGSNLDYLRSATYRVVAAPAGSFPRVGNIWLGDYLNQNQPALAKKVQLFLGPNGMSAADAAALRAANPDVLIVPSIQVDDDFTLTLPESYYLHDTNGNRVSDWCSPPSYVYNVTRPEVAAYLAREAYQVLAQSNWVFDGLFFDSFGTTKPVKTTDCHGNTVLIDSNDDGLPDDQTALNAAWAAGEYLVVSTFRSLAPGAYVSGHVLESPAQPASLAAFNGTSLEFFQQYIREGQASFGTLWNLYQSWETQAVSPAFTLMQSAPPNQIAYGYGYYPLKAMSPDLATFAQTFYPNMRFGLALALMNDGFSTHDIGDIAPLAATAWWYDEYDFTLGYPLGPANQVAMQPSTNILNNPGFEDGLSSWHLNVTNDGQAQAAAATDSTLAADGTSSAHINVISAATANWHVMFEQDNLPLMGNSSYQLQFWARSDSPRPIYVQTQGGAPNYPGYGLYAQFAVGTSWSLYTASFTAPITANDARLEFWMGDVAGNVWLDGVVLAPAGSQIYRRDFTNGVALLNGTSSAQTISGLGGLQRFKGTQAPLYQYIVDDADTGFTATGAWNVVSYNTGSLSGAGASANLPAEPQNANGPYYHAWLGSCHQLDGSSGTAQWDLSLPADGAYTIQVWLPAAPNASTWTKNAVYEVVSNGNVIFTASLDQTTAGGGDGWHIIATGLNLTAAGAPFLRVHNGGSGPLIADAVYVTSAALYNDGSPAPQVTLAPFDGILLQRQTPVPAPTSRVNSVANAASYQPAIASGGFVSIVGTGFFNSSRSWTSSDFSGNDLPTSLDGVSVTIDGKPAYVEYISPTQINAIAPDDDTIGQVQVQVTTPQGASYSGTALKQKLSPAFFAYQSGTTSYVAAVHLDGTLVGPVGPSSRPAAPGEVIEIYGTGFGPTNPPVPTAQLVAQPAPLSLPALVTIGGVSAQVQWAGIMSSGLYQLNVQIPSIGAGDQPVQVTVSGFQGGTNAFVTVAPQ